MYIKLKCVFTYIKAGGRILSSFKNNYLHTISNNKPWSVLFFGTDEFALQSLEALHNLQQEKKAINRLEIVTSYKGEENAVINYAKKKKILLHVWPPNIQEKEFDIGVVVSFGQLIPSKIINLFPLGMINVHGSLLPRWRGAAPICHALINGDECTGVSIMKIMPKKFDIGSVISQKEILINPHDTYLDLYDKLARLGAKELVEIIHRLPDVLNNAKPQTENDVTNAPKISKETSFVRWNDMTAKDVYNLQRALTGIQPLRTYFKDKVIKLLNIKIAPENEVINCKEEKKPGLVVFDKKTKSLYVHCQGNTWITVGTVIIPGKRPQSAADFGSGFILSQKEKSCRFC